MTNTATCESCVHFDGAHNMCTAEVIMTAFGPNFVTRTQNSPACWSNYVKQCQPGEISLLFEQNRIQSSESLS